MKINRLFLKNAGIVFIFLSVVTSCTKEDQIPDANYLKSLVNSQLTTTIADLITPAFLSGYESSSDFSSVRDALNDNSVEAWHSYKPVLLIHGGSDTQVNPVSTEKMYTEMIQAGTSPDL